MKVRVTELVDVPKSILWSKGEHFDEESWTSLVEILQQELLGGGPAAEDPIPPPGVDPHPLTPSMGDFPGFHFQAMQHQQQDAIILPNMEEDEDDINNH